MERPLSEVYTRALYALHKGIKKRSGLSGKDFHNDLAPKDCRVCSLGSLGNDNDNAKMMCYEFGLLSPKKQYPDRLGIFLKGGSQVNFANNTFLGTPEERREFMLRLMVDELHHRGESLVKKTNKKYQEVK